MEFLIVMTIIYVYNLHIPSFSLSFSLSLSLLKIFFWSFLQLLVGDIEVVSTTEEIARTQSSSLNTRALNTLHTAKPVQVDEDDPILDRATKLDHLCTNDRDYFLLESDAVTAEEYAKLSLGSETTDDSHVQQLSLPHCDDSLSTTVSEESDCTAAVRVYDLNKRETKILRHDIIKQSRNSIGGESINPFEHLGDCCSSTKAKERADSPLQSAIHQFNSRILENVHETRKPPRSPNKLRSVHLNRNPRKLKMADVQLMNDAFGTSLDPKIIDEIRRKSSASDYVDSSTENGASADNELVTATENLLQCERQSSKISVGDSVQAECHESSNPNQQSDEPAATAVDSSSLVLTQSNESANDDHSNVQNHTENIEIKHVEIKTEPSELTPPVIELKIESIVEPTAETVVETTIETQNVLQTELPTESTIQTNTESADRALQIETRESTVSEQHLYEVKRIYERNQEVIVQVNLHKEKSVIEEEVIPALPSVKELAQKYAKNKTDDDIRPERLNRPKVNIFSISNFQLIATNLEAINFNAHTLQDVKQFMSLVSFFGFIYCEYSFHIFE